MRNDGVGERAAPSEAIAQKKPVDPDKIFTRTQLMDEIWGLTTETSQSTLNVHVNRLRNKFRKYPEFDLKAVRGIGYKAEVHVD